LFSLGIYLQITKVSHFFAFFSTVKVMHSFLQFFHNRIWSPRLHTKYASEKINRIPWQRHKWEEMFFSAYGLWERFPKKPEQVCIRERSSKFMQHTYIHAYIHTYVHTWVKNFIPR
jgi:hypothetical protein